MTRWSALTIALVAINLIACCCGAPLPKNPPIVRAPAAKADVGKPEPANPPDAKKNDVEVKQPADNPADKKPLAKNDPELDGIPQDVVAKIPPKPIEVVFKPIKREWPVRKFEPVLTSSLKSAVDSIKIELLSAEIEPTEFKDRHLVIKIRIHNNGLADVPFTPWREESGKNAVPPAKDEHGRGYRVRTPRTLKKEASGIPMDKSIESVVAFAAPDPVSEEVDISLPGANVSLFGQQFKFKIGRAFFAQQEDKRLWAVEVERQETEHKKMQAAQLRQWAETKQKILDDYETDRLAKLEAERKRAEKQEAERQAILEAQRKAAAIRLGVTRAGYNKLYEGIGLQEAQDILGPAREDVRSGPFLTVSWRGTGFVPTIITATFEGNRLKSKAIIGD